LARHVRKLNLATFIVDTLISSTNFFRVKEGSAMLYWAVVFLVVALIAALFGFGGIAAGAAGLAKILFFVFIVLVVVSLLFGGMRRGPTV
jgi:uncharacterized membrane protein YtjA (UPF0391 family)